MKTLTSFVYQCVIASMPALHITGHLNISEAESGHCYTDSSTRDVSDVQKQGNRSSEGEMVLSTIETIFSFSAMLEPPRSVWTLGYDQNHALLPAHTTVRRNGQMSFVCQTLCPSMRTRVVVTVIHGLVSRSTRFLHGTTYGDKGKLPVNVLFNQGSKCVPTFSR